MSHAKLSPSSAHRWMRCPGAIREEANYPETTNDAAIDGTHSHTLLEHCLKNPTIQPDDLIGVTLSDHYGEFEVDQESMDRVRVALTYINERKYETPVSVRSEEQVDMGQILGREDLWGTADVQIVSDGVYEVIDYKDGHAPIDPDSPQLRLYAVGGAHEYRYDDGSLPFTTIRQTIIQPRLSNPIKTHETTPDELNTWFITELAEALRQVDNPDAPLVAGTHCKYCRASGNCAAQAEQALKGAQVMFENVELAQQSADQNPNELSDDKIKEILEAKPVIMEFLKSVEAEAFRRFDTGHPVPGMKMVYSGKGRASWRDDVDVEKALKGMKVPKSEIYRSTMVTPSQAKGLKWKNRKGEEMSLTKRQAEKLDNDLITKSKGNKMIVPESDRREAIHTDAESLFENVEVETVPDWLKPQE